MSAAVQRERVTDRPVGCLAADRTYGDQEYGGNFSVRWAFPAFMTDEEIRDRLDSAGVDVEGRRCCHEYDCCGRWYCDSVTISRRASRRVVIVRQGYYQNV